MVNDMDDRHYADVTTFFEPKSTDYKTFNPLTNDFYENPCVPGNPALIDIPFIIIPHPDTPLVNNASPETVQQIFREAAGNPALYSNEVLEHIRQFAKTNLWFLMTVILSFNGPFDLVNDHLHMDMANFRQSKYWRGQGARAAAFIPRSHLKSTIFTIAGTIFDLLRNPEERHLIVNANRDKAFEFLHAIQQPFENNNFFQDLFNEYCPKSGDEWTKMRFVLPNRQRQYKDASCFALSVTSAGEGTHVDQLTIDDPVGLDDIDNNRSSNENMRAARNFFITADPALLISRKRSRIGFVGTRWAADDVAELAVADAIRFHGYEDKDFKTSKTGKWHIYYRLCAEEGKPIYPEEWSNDDFEDIASKDWWNFATQYANKPQISGIVEFSDYRVKQCSLELQDGKYYISYEDDRKMVSLDYCDVVLTCDPAGTEKEIKAATSRTSLAVWALDGHGRYSRIWGRVGYMNPVKMIDHIFRAHEIFPGYIRNTLIEANAMQKILLPILRKEEGRKGRSIRPRPQMAQGDKKARIRNTLALPLSEEKIYAVPGPGTFMALSEEMKLFPSSSTKLDVLDESEKAISALRLPETEEASRQREEDEEDEAVMEYTPLGHVGYTDG